jgi:hypothetical protein
LIETIEEVYEYGEHADWQSVPYLGKVCRNEGKERHYKYWFNKIRVVLASIAQWFRAELPHEEEKEEVGLYFASWWFLDGIIAPAIIFWRLLVSQWRTS